MAGRQGDAQRGSDGMDAGEGEPEPTGSIDGEGSARVVRRPATPIVHDKADWSSLPGWQ